MSARDLLFEIGTEEIPARFVTWAIDELGKIASEELESLRVVHGGVRVLATPRRLALCVSALDEHQRDLEETVKGPPAKQARDADGNYTKAALGFAKSKGIEPSALNIEEIGGVEYVCAVVREVGRKTEELLSDLLLKILSRLVFPKSMYWEDPAMRFARPVRWLVALYGDAAVPLSFGRVRSGRTTRGHRFMGRSAVEIPNPQDYVNILESEHVIVDQAKRKAMIAFGIAELEKQLGGKIDESDDLLEENTQLVEYPVLFTGSFEESFLEIPEEVLIATMKKNQRYFPVRGASGRLTNAFIGVSNNKARDMAVVRDGNERVLRARLCDAAFFWKEDQAASLESRVPMLEKVMYQKKLGSVLDKVERVRKIAAWLARHIGMESKKDAVDRAAFLSKADLVTSMVFEFPEVQGVMGREYARRGGESDEVATALYEQYLPKFAGDSLPSGIAGAIVGIADRADSLVGIHSVGLAPTGSQDPYALRRAARCINEIIWGMNIDIDLAKLFAESVNVLGAGGEVLDKVLDFTRHRLHVQLRERDYGHGMTSLAVATMGHRPLQALRMLEALDESSRADWFGDLVLSAVRVNNILAKAEGENIDALRVDPSVFTTDAERALHEVVGTQAGVVKKAVEGCAWNDVNAALVAMAPHIKKFFDDVLVMDDDPSIRRNRLALLAECRLLFGTIGDFSLLK